MIEHLEINGVHVDVQDNIKKYVYRKIGRLDRILPRHARKSVRARVILSEIDAKHKESVCEVILKLPQKTISAKDQTTNMFSSVDIVEAKLARQIRKYKTALANQNKSTKISLVGRWLDRFKK